MEFFWGTLAPFTVLVAFGMAVLVFVLGVWNLQGDAGDIARVAALVVGAGLLLNLPVQYYLVKSRLHRPIERLAAELQGRAPWRAEGDVLLNSLRRATEQVRDRYAASRLELERAQEITDELRERAAAHAAADRLAARLAESLRTAEPVAQFGPEVATLIREFWPADHVLLLYRDDSQADLEILYHAAGGTPVEESAASEEGPRYRKTSLPPPVKGALRRGFYAESGLPFSQDPAFPEARSFIAMALDHRGPGAGVLLLASSTLVPPPPEILRRAQPLISLGFSRAMYLRELGDAAIRDGLTGAYTYDHFLLTLRHEMARSNRYSRPVSCLILDIDNLRRINDRYDARGGDQVIAEVAQLARNLIRSSDILARISGGRLALLLPETNAEAALTVADRVRAKIEEHPFIVQRGVVERVTASLGIGVHPPHGVTALALVDAAHQALQEAKARGRNQVAIRGEVPDQEGEAPPDGESSSESRDTGS